MLSHQLIDYQLLLVLQSLHTYGFRGEALSSLSALGELAVITRTAELAAATRLEFDRDGRLTASSPVARAVGTTVAVKDLFGTLPVRRQVRSHLLCRGQVLWALGSTVTRLWLHST